MTCVTYRSACDQRPRRPCRVLGGWALQGGPCLRPEQSLAAGGVHGVSGSDRGPCAWSCRTASGKSFSPGWPRQWLRRLEWVWRGAEVVSGVQPPQPTTAGAWLRAWGRWVLSSDCVGMNDRMNGRTARPREVAMAAGPRGAGRSPGRVPGSRTCSGGAAASLSGFGSRIRIPDSDRFVCGRARSHAHARGGPRPGRRTRTHGTRMRGGPASAPPRAAPAPSRCPGSPRPAAHGLRPPGGWVLAQPLPQEAPSNHEDRSAPRQATARLHTRRGPALPPASRRGA